jgi:competence protein ComEC
MIASLAGMLAFMAWRRAPVLMLALAAPRAAALAGFLAALLYCMIAGFAIPAQRTLFMLAVAAWAMWHGWFGSGLRVLSIALGLVCLLDPWAPLSPGFWLSFGAVAILLISAARFGKPGHWLAEAANAQLAVTFGLLPLSLALFQQVSIAGPIANALAIPLVSFVVTPLAIAASIVPVDFLAHAAHAVLDWLMQFLQWLSSFEWAIWQRAAPPTWVVLLATAGAAWLVVPTWWQWRLVGAVWMLPMLAHEPSALPDGTFRVDVLDVGQGLATTVRTHGHSLVFDTGPQYSPEADGGNRVIVPFLRGEGISRIDALVLSHDDSDHTGGAASTLKALNPHWMVSPLPPNHPLRTPDLSHRRCSAGDTWEWDGVRFEFLNPPGKMDLADPSLKDNARSCVLAISAHGKRVLVAADIEADVERRLVADAVALRSDVLVVPHHGSKTSSTPGFIDAVAPTAAIFPVGYRNRFRHPAPEIVERYTSRGIAIHRTDLDGAIAVKVDAGPLRIDAWRERRQRYWHGR